MRIKECPRCKKNMIKRYEGMLPSDMLMSCGNRTYRWEWWCACGHTTNGGTTTSEEVDEFYKSVWNQMNPKEQWLWG